MPTRWLHFFRILDRVIKPVAKAAKDIGNQWKVTFVPPFQPNTTTLNTLHAKKPKASLLALIILFIILLDHVLISPNLASCTDILLMSALRSGLFQELIQGTTVHPTTGPQVDSRFHAPGISVGAPHFSTQLVTVR